jgi:predicted TIM-barrel fold metal-dependent hydrolase
MAKHIETPRINVHLHLFTADHTPEIQFYYIIRDLVATGGISLDWLDVLHTRPLGRLFLWLLIRVVLLIAFFLRGLAGHILDGFAQLMGTVSRAGPEDFAAILGVPGRRPRFVHVVRYFRDGLREWKGLPSPGRESSPINYVVKKFVGKVYERHRANSAGQGSKSQQEVLASYLGAIEDATNFSALVVLSMDFDEAFRNVFKPNLKTCPDVCFADQAAELTALSAGRLQETPQIIPFVCIDPRSYDVVEGDTRAKMRSVIEDYVSRGFYGVKLYPPLGYLPEDVRLEGVFDYCMENQLPVLVHGGISGAGRKGAINCGDLAHPYYWIPVLNRLAKGYHEAESRGMDVRGWKFRLCLAHFGGSGPMSRESESWWDEVISLMDLYAQEPAVEVYTDISYNVPKKRRQARRYCKGIRRDFCLSDFRRSRILFGCDWWMYLYEMDPMTYYDFVFRRWRGSSFFPRCEGREGLLPILDANARRFLGPLCAGRLP